jgi:hypothetical protein
MSYQVVMSNSSAALLAQNTKPAPQKESMWKKWRVEIGTLTGWGTIQAVLGAVGTKKINSWPTRGDYDIGAGLFYGFCAMITESVRIVGLAILGVGIVGGIYCLAYDYYHRKA